MNSPEWNSEEGISKLKKEHEEEAGTMGQHAMQCPLDVSFGLAACFHRVFLPCEFLHCFVRY